jgi:uncharacterized protein (DUF927 family)
MLAVSMGFAGVLLSPLGVEGGGVHFRGPSSEGKTTALLAAASVWGEPGRVEHWRATANGLEGVAAAHNDNLLLLDELKEIDPREAGAVAYMLSNGSGKRRGRPEGGTRPRLTWRVLFLSTGEVSLAQHVEVAGHRVHAGQEVRLIDLGADAGRGQGVFEELHGFASGQVFADGLRQRVHEAYGTAGRAFVEVLVKDMPHAMDQVHKLCDLFMQHRVPKAATGQVLRVAGRFALIGAAGELATNLGLTGWEPGMAAEAAAMCFDAWLQQRGTLTNTDEERALAQVRLYFERYGEARFTPWGVAPTPCPRCQGTGQYATGTCFECHGSGTLAPADADNGRVYDRAGFRRETADERTEYFVLPEVFRKEIAKGVDSVWLGKVLVAHGLLTQDSQGKVTSNVRLPGLGQTRVYHFSPEITGTA